MTRLKWDAQSANINDIYPIIIALWLCLCIRRRRPLKHNPLPLWVYWPNKHKTKSNSKNTVQMLALKFSQKEKGEKQSEKETPKWNSTAAEDSGDGNSFAKRWKKQRPGRGEDCSNNCTARWPGSSYLASGLSFSPLRIYLPWPFWAILTELGFR